MILFRGKKAKLGPVRTMDITARDIFECFAPSKGEEFKYLGYAFYYVGKDGSMSFEGQCLKEFFKEVDKAARPRWCPRFLLRLLNLFGNDNSIVRVRNFALHRLFNRITGGIRIIDTKWKWDSFRIYGNFTKELNVLAKETCERIERGRQ